MFKNNSKQKPEENTMNMFSNRMNAVRNVVPLTLKMIKSIDVHSKKLDNIFQIQKISILVRIINVAHNIGGKIQIDVRDQSSSDRHIIHLFRPKYAEDMNFSQGQYYKFECQLREDHGDIVLNGIRYKKIANFNQIIIHNMKIMNAQIWRKKQNKNNQEQKQYQI